MRAGINMRASRPLVGMRRYCNSFESIDPRNMSQLLRSQLNHYWIIINIHEA
jgi:hypothetical protein